MYISLVYCILYCIALPSSSTIHLGPALPVLYFPPNTYFFLYHGTVIHFIHFVSLQQVRLPLVI